MTDSFVQVMTRLRAGESDAATQLFERFSQRLVGIARNQLCEQLKRKVAPEDVAQSVFISFFRRDGEGKFTLEDWNGLWGLLVTMTLRKCRRKAEFFRADRRDVRREAGAMVAEADSDILWEPSAAEPTPQEAAVLSEIIEQAMRQLDERGRRVFSLKLQGYSIPEISSEIGRTERTVFRTLEDIRAHLEKSIGQTTPA